MTIIAILLAFAISYFVKDVVRLRINSWINPFVRWCNNTLSMLPGWPGITSFLVILGLPLLALALLQYLVSLSFGLVGSFLLAVIVLLYTIGPRGLDSDVTATLDAETDEEEADAAEQLLGKPAPEDEADRRAALTDAVFIQGLRRWFGVMFWFAILGPVGALLYRLVNWLLGDRLNLSDRQRHSFWRLREVMEWPVAQLMTLGLAITADFDSVLGAWKQYHNEQGHSLFEGDNGFLLAAGRQVVLTGRAGDDGFADQLAGPHACMQLAMDMIWRILGVWLTVMALMLLVGWIA